MFPVLLLILLVVTALSSGKQEAISEGVTGRTFVVAFPENIANFYPAQPTNNIIITALYHHTEVVITEHERLVDTLTLGSGETRVFEVSAHLELSRSEISNSSLQISSNNLVTVHEVFHKHHSIQTSLVIPTDKLGTDYLIPPVPIINGTSHHVDQVTTFVTENNPFRLIIINIGQHNTVSLTGVGSKNVSLLPHQVASIWLKPEEAFTGVSAKMPFAVLFGHACAYLRDCTCAQLYTALLPTKGDRQKFYIPPLLTKDAENETYILMSTKKSRQVKLANQVSPLLEARGSAILYRSGLLLPLIPETDHGACFLAITIPNAINVAVIVVQSNLRAGVHLGHQSLESLDWQQLEGTDYISAQVNLQSEKSVIWHSSSKMAVYSVGFKDSQVFGNPAAVISKNEDFRGCLLEPEVVKIGEVAGGWRESLRYCQNQQLQLISFPRRQHQTQVYNKIQGKDAGLRDLWIGMRRSSQSGRWYWLSNEPVTETNWAEGEPSTVNEAQCVIMTSKSYNFSWRDESCCRDAHPVCYKDPTLLPM